MRLFSKIIALPLICLILYHVFIYGNIMSFRAIAPKDTAFMRLRMQQFEQTHPDIKLNYQWVEYDKISIHLKKAIIASEDANFAEHSGFDWTGIRSAIQRNQRSGKIRSGGSTISQQLSKNLFLSEQRSYLRKGEEAIITAMLEATTPKERIYEIYLNVVEWGYGVYGAEAAAQTLFKQSATKLNKTQSAQLAARLPAPLRYADSPRDARLRNKTNIILRRMKSATLPE